MADGVEFSIIIQYLEGDHHMTTNARDEKWSEWIDWSGGVCPLPAGTVHEPRFRSGPTLEDNFPESWRWNHEGVAGDIIAYRYKIKEPESEMHPDLEWLARNTRPKQFGQMSVRRNRDFHSGYQWSDLRQTGDGWYHHSKVKAARQQLGLDQPAVTPEEEEAWQAKERKLIGGPRKAESFLMQAADLMAERGEQYDQDGGERSMGKTVSAFNTITGRDLTESEGWLLMSILKRVRQHSGAGYHKDSAEDAVAYAALEAEALECAATQQS